MSKPFEQGYPSPMLSEGPKIKRLLQGLHDNSRKRLQEVASFELDKIRSSVEKELARKRMLERLETADLI